MRALLEKHPWLAGELSYRPGLTGADGRLSDEWRALRVQHPDRFTIGSDNWIDNARRQDDETPSREARRWLGELPPELVQRIAWGNGARGFGLAEPR